MKLISSLTATTAILIASAGQIASALPANAKHTMDRRQSGMNGGCTLRAPNSYSMIFSWIPKQDVNTPGLQIGVSANAGAPLWSHDIPDGRNTLMFDYVVEGNQAKLFWNTQGAAPLEAPTDLNSAANLVFGSVPATFEVGFIVNGQLSEPARITLAECQPPAAPPAK